MPLSGLRSTAADPHENHILASVCRDRDLATGRTRLESIQGNVQQDSDNLLGIAFYRRQVCCDVEPCLDSLLLRVVRREIDHRANKRIHLGFPDLRSPRARKI